MNNDQEIAGFGLEESRTAESQSLRSSGASRTLGQEEAPDSHPATPSGRRPGRERGDITPILSRGERESDSVSVVDRTLREYLEAYVGGEANYARTIRRGGILIGSSDGIDEETKDRLTSDFHLQLEKTARREKELCEERGEGNEERSGDKRKEASQSQIGSPRPCDDSRGSDGKRVRISEKIREDELPWFKFAGEEISLTTSMQKTRAILEYISKDVGSAKQWVVSAVGAPKRFPDSEWGNILQGRAVNLHHVFAGMHLLRPVPESSACVGGIEVTLPNQSPAKRIESGLEWQGAWALALEATAFVFPHRRVELERYGSFILQKLISKGTSAHKRIILFDESVHEAVGGGENTSLLDLEVRQPFVDSILEPDGVEYNSAYRRGMATGICNRFNSRGGCKGANCRFQHKCQKCKEEGHGQSQCREEKHASTGDKA